MSDLCVCMIQTSTEVRFNQFTSLSHEKRIKCLFLESRKRLSLVFQKHSYTATVRVISAVISYPTSN